MKRTKYILCTALLVAGLSSCAKTYLDTESTTSISQTKATNTIDGLKALVNGLHNMSYIYSFDQATGTGQPSLNYVYDGTADDYFNTYPAIQMYSYRYQDQTSPEGDLNMRAWDYYYTLIAHANVIIDGARAIQQVSEQDRAAVIGEALAYRAWAYHYLVQLFGPRYVAGAANDGLGVILRLGENRDKPQARATVAETYAQINKDIQEALDYLSKAKDPEVKNHIRYSTACGIAARIALTQSDWAGVEKYAKLAIDKSGATLQSGNALLDGFNNWSATEWMWAYSPTSDQDQYYNGFFALTSYNFGGGNRSIRFAVNRAIYDKMGTADVRRKWWVCLDQGDKIPADAFSSYFLGGTSAPKWEVTGQSIKYKVPNPQSSRGDVFLMRLAEMYYILAEAQYRQGNESDAKATLLAIMATRDENYATDHSSDLTGTNLLDEIFRNKRVDLWGEGHRFFDLKRQNVGFSRLPSKNLDYLTSKADKERAIARNSGVNSERLPTTADSKYWQYMIPYGEIKGNPLCQQNPL